MKTEERHEAEFEARFEAQERLRRTNYKICCMNGINPHTTINGSMHIDWQTQTIQADQVYLDHNGNPVRISEDELFTVTVEAPIIALPHEIRDAQ